MQQRWCSEREANTGSNPIIKCCLRAFQREIDNAPMFQSAHFVRYNSQRMSVKGTSAEDDTGRMASQNPYSDANGARLEGSTSEPLVFRTRRELEFERLYRESYGSVYGYVRVRMSCDADAEDVVAEAYMKAARSFESFDPSRAKFVTWVTTIAKNCMISFFRRSKPTAGLKDAPQEAYAVDGEQNVVDDILYAKKLLACLSDEERMLIACKYRDGMRNVDIAREMGMNASTVSTMLARALSKMRAYAERGA